MLDCVFGFADWKWAAVTYVPSIFSQVTPDPLDMVIVYNAYKWDEWICFKAIQISRRKLCRAAYRRARIRDDDNG